MRFGLKYMLAVVSVACLLAFQLSRHLNCRESIDALKESGFDVIRRQDGGLQIIALSLNDDVVTTLCRCLPFIPDVVEIDLGVLYVDDARIRKICESKSLRKLKIWNARITDAGIDSICSVESLEEVEIGRHYDDEFEKPYKLYDTTYITTDALARLARLPNVKRIACFGNDFTDECIPCLIEMANRLDRLELLSTRITVPGIIRIQQASPNCAVFYDHVLSVQYWQNPPSLRVSSRHRMTPRPVPRVNSRFDGRLPRRD